MPPEQARSQNQTTGPNGLIERQVTQELLDLFNIDEQTLNTQGLQITTTIDPKAQQAAEEAVIGVPRRPGPRHAHRGRVDRPENGRGEGLLRRHATPTGFDFAQAGLPTGSSFKVFALVAALQQGMGLGYQVDSSPVTVNGIKITNVEGEGCGVCNIAEALKRSLNTSYYRLMLKLKNGPAGRRRRRAQGRHRRELPRRGPHAVRGRQGRSTQQRNRVGPVPDSRDRHGVGVRHARGLGRVPQAALRAEGGQLATARCCSTPASRTTAASSASTRPSPTTSPPRCSRSPDSPAGHNLAGGRPSAAKTGTNQLGDTDANRDAWMVGYTPSLSTAVWVGTTEGTKPLENASGAAVYGSGLPSDIWKATMDGALEGHRQRVVPEADRDRRLCRRAAGTAAAAVHRAAAAVGDGDPADDRSGAGHHDPVRAADHGARCSGAGGPAPGRRERRRRPLRPGPTPRRRPPAVTARRIASVAGRWCRPAGWPKICAALDDRDLPSRTDVIGAALSGVIGGPVGRHALIGRARFLTPLRVMLLIALVFLALGYSTKAACLQTTGTGTADQRVAQLGEPAGLLRALLLRHRSALHRGVVEPGQVSVQVQLDRDGQRRQAAAPSTTATSPCGTWSIRC